MAGTAPARTLSRPVARVADTASVKPLELFFDLVFVFALTQVTAYLADVPTWGSVGRALLLLAALWWAWGAYTWLANAIDPDEGVVRIGYFLAMGGFFLAALAVPDAFGAEALLFGVAYLCVRVLHAAMYLAAARTDEGLARAIGRMLPVSTLGPLIILAAAFVDEGLRPYLWIVALLVDFASVLRGGGEGWNVSAAHFAERHGLIVIVALGESIVALGIGAESAFGPDAIGGALLGIAIVAALWWAYFDVVALVAERKLTELTGAARAKQARDSYSYLHFPMIAGIILLAFGMKKALGAMDDPMKIVPAVGLCGGAALYLAAHVAFRYRNLGTVNRQRSLAVVVLLVLVPLAREVPAVVTLSAVAALLVALIAYEAVRFAEARERIRHAIEH